MKLARLLIILTSTVLVVAVISVGAFSLLLKQAPRSGEAGLEWLISALLHRQLEINELIEVRIGSNTRVEALGVSLANPPWADESYFASATRIAFEFNLPSLWREGPILVYNIEVEDAVINLQQAGDGPGTWSFWPDSDASPSSVSSIPPVPFILFKGSIDKGTIRFVDDDQDIRADLSSLVLIETESGMLSLSSTGEVNGTDLALEGTAGPATALRTGQDVNVDLVLHWGEFAATMAAFAGDLNDPQSYNAHLQLHSPESRLLLEVLGIPEIRDGPINLEAMLAPSGTRIALDAKATLGAFEVALSGSASAPGQFDELDLIFKLSGPSLREAGSAFELQKLPDVPYTVSGQLSRQGSLLQLDETLIRAADGELKVSGRLPNFPDIDDWTMSLVGQRLDLALVAPLLGLENFAPQVYDLEGNFFSNEQGVELLDIELSRDNARLKLSGQTGQSPSYFGTQLHLELSGEDVSLTAPWLGIKQMPELPFELNGQVRFDEEGWRLIDGRLQSPGFTAGLEGSLDRLTKATAIDARLDFSAPDLSAALATYGISSDLETGLHSTFSAHLSGSAGSLRIDDGELQLDQSLVTVKGSISDLKAVSLTVGAESPDIRKLINIRIPGSPPLPISLTGDLYLDDREIALRRFTGSIPGSSMTVTGSFSLGGAEAADALEAELNLSGQSRRGLEKLFGLETRLPDGQVTLVAEISGRDGLYRAAPLEINYGKSDLRGSLEVQLDQEPEVHAILHSDYLYLPFLAPDLESLEAEEQVRVAAGVNEELEDYEDALTSEELKERIISEVPLQLDWLRRVNGTLDYSIEELFVKDEAKSKGSFALELYRGKLVVNTGKWDGTYSAGSYAMTLDASQDVYEFEIEIDGERLPLLWLLAGEPDYEDVAMYKARLSGRGNTPREIAASLNGAMLFRAEGGRMNNRGLDLIFGDLLGEFLNSLNPKKRERTYTKIVCNAGALFVNDGVVEAIPGLILRTGKTDLLAAGKINLRNERMDMAFSTRARKGLGISAGRSLSRHVKLGGTLANPRLILDTTATAVSSGAAVATAGWSILARGVWDRWVATAGDPCKRLIKQALKDPKRDYLSLSSPTLAPTD